MGRRGDKARKLGLQKETLRALQLRQLSEEQLRAAAGGVSAGCSDCCHAPSQLGC